MDNSWRTLTLSPALAGVNFFLSVQTGSSHIAYCIIEGSWDIKTSRKELQRTL